MADYFIGVDVGTTETKAVLFRIDGAEICKCSLEVSLQLYNQHFIEQDYAELWNKTACTIRNLIKKSRVNPKNIAFVSVTGQRDTLGAIDKHKKVLGKGISWRDSRGREFLKLISDRVGNERIYKITGLPINTMPWASKILWLKRYKEELYRKTWKFLGVVDYVIFKLTDVLITDYSNAGRTQLFDINKKVWSDELFQTLNLDKEKMLEVVPSGTLVSSVTVNACIETGLSKETAVVYGGGDQQCSSLGAGVTSLGRVCCIIGTCTNMEMYVDKIPYDPKNLLEIVVHVAPNSYLLEGGVGTSGIIYRWFRDEFGDTEKIVANFLKKEAYDILDKEASKSPPGSLGLMLIPYFAGSEYPYWNPNDRGAIIGLLLSHKREHLIRAILEGVAYEFRKIVGEGEKVAGTNVSELRFVGGGAKSSLWPKIFVDILGIPGQILDVHETGALGAGILGTVALGWQNDVKRASDELVKIRSTVKPNPKAHILYDKLFSIYYQMYDRIRDLVNAVSNVYAENIHSK